MDGKGIEKELEVAANAPHRGAWRGSLKNGEIDRQVVAFREGKKARERNSNAAATCDPCSARVLGLMMMMTSSWHTQHTPGDAKALDDDDDVGLRERIAPVAGGFESLILNE